jgi:hypothetical protein
MNAHGPRHEEILRDIAVGDLAESAPAAREALESCSECRERLAELREAAARLDAAAAEERAIRDAAERLPPGAATGESRVGEILRAAAARAATRPEDRSGAPARRPRLPRLAAAVMILAGLAGLVAIVRSTLRDRDPTPPGPILVGDEIEAIAPRGLVESFEIFEWRAELPPLGWCVVHVHRAGAGQEVPPLAVSQEIEDTRWHPGEEVVRGWPREIEWEVHVYDAEGDSHGGSKRIAATRREP